MKVCLRLSEVTKTALISSDHGHLGIFCSLWFLCVLPVGGVCNHGLGLFWCSITLGSGALGGKVNSLFVVFLKHITVPPGEATADGKCNCNVNEVCWSATAFRLVTTTSMTRPKDSQRPRSSLLLASFVSGINVVTDWITYPHRLTTAMEGINHRKISLSLQPHSRDVFMSTCAGKKNPYFSFRPWTGNTPPPPPGSFWL